MYNTECFRKNFDRKGHMLSEKRMHASWKKGAPS